MSIFTTFRLNFRLLSICCIFRNESFRRVSMTICIWLCLITRSKLWLARFRGIFKASIISKRNVGKRDTAAGWQGFCWIQQYLAMERLNRRHPTTQTSWLFRIPFLTFTPAAIFNFSRDHLNTPSLHPITPRRRLIVHHRLSSFIRRERFIWMTLQSG